MQEASKAERHARNQQYETLSATMRDEYERYLNQQAISILEATMKKTTRKTGKGGRKC